MKNSLFSKILLMVCVSIFMFGCEFESGEDKPIAVRLSVAQMKLNEIQKNFFVIQKSMRKIDSLSADLNLRFTRINAKGI